MRMKVLTAAAAVLGASLVSAAPAGASMQDICTYTTEEWGEVCTSMVVPLVQNRVDCVETYGALRCLPRVPDDATTDD